METGLMFVNSHAAVWQVILDRNKEQIRFYKVIEERQSFIHVGIKSQCLYVYDFKIITFDYFKAKFLI